MDRRTVLKSAVAAASLLPTLTVSKVIAAPSPRRVLVTLSSEAELELREGARYPTGYYLNEFAIPVQALIQGGFTPVFANPRGNRPSMDRRSDHRSYFGGDEAKRAATLRFVENLADLERPRTFAAVLEEGIDRFAGIFVPGGHAPMQDLVRDVELGHILRRFHAAAKPTALICHGPIALLSALPDPAAFHEALVRNDNAALTALSDGWIYNGYRLAVFSTAEERVAEADQLRGRMRFYPSEALVAAGAKVETGRMWQSQVVQDRELITGQQPASDGELARRFLEALRSR